LSTFLRMRKEKKSNENKKKVAPNFFSLMRTHVFDVHALFVAERKERVKRVYERDDEKRKTFTMREQRATAVLFFHR